MILIVNGLGVGRSIGSGVPPPPSRIPPYIGVVDKKRGDNTIDEIFWKFFWEKGESIIFFEST